MTWCLAEDPHNPAEQWEEDYYSRAEIRYLHESRKSAMEVIVARLGAMCPRRGYLLDVGAGIGVLMDIAAKDGWYVEGVEPSKRAAECAHRRTGATVHKGLFHEVELPAGKYDVVTIIDTLRSVSRPLAFLQTARRLLRPGGVIVIREAYGAVLRYYGRLTRRTRGVNVDETRRVYTAAQWFSPRSLIYAFQSVGSEGWVEPSPVFVEAGSSRGLLVSATKRAVGRASAALYRASGRRIIISPNLLAFGRTPD